MSVIRVCKNASKNFVVMSKTHIFDKRMSLKVKSLLTLMLALPDNWDYSAVGLASLVPDGNSSVRSGLKELERLGYLIRKPLKNSKGRIFDWEYQIFEEPTNGDFPQPCYPHVDFSQVGSPQVGNRTQYNNKEINTKEMSNKKLNNPPLCPPKGEVTLTGDGECRFEDDADNPSSWETPDFVKDLFSETADESETDENAEGEQINPSTQTVFDTWNEKKILVHKTLTPELKRTIEKAVKAYGYDRVLIAIGRYSEMLKNEEYTMMTYRWSLRDFLKRVNALPEFMDDGSKWVNYCEYLKNPKPSTSNYQAQTNNDVEDDDKDAYSDWEKNLPF